MTSSRNLTHTLGFLAVLLFTTFVHGNTPLSSTVVDASMNSATNRGLKLALASRPMWHLTTMIPLLSTESQRTCYPTAALDSSGKQHGTDPQKWPDAGSGCPEPGGSFPTYWTVKQCSEDEIRVIYGLYFSHDGFNNTLISKGHVHDWERIVVVWGRNATSGDWTRTQILESRHSGYRAKSWDEIESTFSYDNQDEFGGKNKDGAKIYVGWAKHAMFDTKETTWRDSFSQGCNREYRDDTWSFLPQEGDMIWAAAESEEGKKMKEMDWGSATGTPWAVEDEICEKGDGGFIEC